jgi:hypothetical protein
MLAHCIIVCKSTVSVNHHWGCRGPLHCLPPPRCAVTATATIAQLQQLPPSRSRYCRRRPHAVAAAAATTQLQPLQPRSCRCHAVAVQLLLPLLPPPLPPLPPPPPRSHRHRCRLQKKGGERGDSSHRHHQHRQRQGRGGGCQLSSPYRAPSMPLPLTPVNRHPQRCPAFHPQQQH